MTKKKNESVKTTHSKVKVKKTKVTHNTDVKFRFIDTVLNDVKKEISDCDHISVIVELEKCLKNIKLIKKDIGY